MANDIEKNSLSELERDNIALIRRWFKEVWNDRRIETIQEFMSPNIVYHVEFEKIEGINSWEDGIYTAIIKAIPDVCFEVEDIIANGENIVVR